MSASTMNSQLQASGVAALAGVATHLAFFIRGEHHRYGVTLIKLYAGLVLLLGASLFAIKKYAFADALIATLAVSTSYLAGLYSSILIYRAFLHPLRKFKGPFRAKLSNIFHAVLIRKSDNYLHVTKMHEKYGPIVRIGTQHATDRH
jgi:tryprostatin B 6-hydroxylase